MNEAKRPRKKCSELSFIPPDFDCGLIFWKQYFLLEITRLGSPVVFLFASVEPLIGLEIFMSIFSTFLLSRSGFDQRP